MSRIVLGLSGGVDSAAAAHMLKKAGHEVAGVFLSSCFSQDDGEAAVSAARELGIDFVRRDISRELCERVCDVFIDAYLHGETPNPCVLCNPGVKFAALRAEKDRLGFDYVATGHYARNLFCAEEGTELIFAAPGNDQSYMLSRLVRTDDLIFPLGELPGKTDVRAYAAENGLSCASRPDSMEICFIPDGDYVKFIEKYTSRADLDAAKGDFVAPDGSRHPHGGIYRYTVGQKSGLGIALGKKLTVEDIDPATKDVLLSEAPAPVTRLYMRDFAMYSELGRDDRLFIRIRHSKTFYPGRLLSVSRDGEAVAEFEQPLPAPPCPGQTAALYKDYAEGRAVAAAGAIVRPPREK